MAQRLKATAALDLVGFDDPSVLIPKGSELEIEYLPNDEYIAWSPLFKDWFDIGRNEFVLKTHHA